MTKKRKSGRPTPEGGARKEIVKVSLNRGELATIMKATEAPAQYLREAGLEKAINHKRIEGFVDKTEFKPVGRINLFREKIEGDLPAVLFIGENGKPPKVFSEEEVKAMLRDILIIQTIDQAGIATVDTERIEAIAAHHGITL